MKTLVIVLTYNAEPFLKDCFSSLLDQAEKADVLAVDNASSDQTVERLKKEFPQVGVIQNRRNLGFAAGNNVGLRYAIEHGYEMIVLLNQDTKVTRNFIETGVAAMNDSKVGLASPTILFFGTHQIWWAGSELERGFGLLFSPHYKLGWHRNKRQEATPERCARLQTDWVPGCALFTRRDVLEKVGLLDERFFFLGEDVDFSFRVRAAGYTLLHYPEASVEHKEKMDNPKFSFSFHFFHKAFRFFKADLLILWRYYRRSELIFFLIHLPFFPLWSMLRGRRP